MLRLRNILGCSALVLGGLVIGFVAATVTPQSWATTGILNGTVSAPAQWFWTPTSGDPPSNGFGFLAVNIVNGAAPSTVQTILANRIRCQPYVSPHTGNLDTMSFFLQTPSGITNSNCTGPGVPAACCTGAGTGTCLGNNCSVAIYNADLPNAGFFPTTKVYGDTTPFDCSVNGSPGLRKATPNAAFVQGQLYWMCTWYQATEAVLTLASASLGISPRGWFIQGANVVTGTGLQLTKTFPTTFTGTSWPTNFSTLGAPADSNNSFETVLWVSFNS